jgi:hypothetical protein
VIGILGHIATADTDPTADELSYIESRLMDGHTKIEALWNQVWEDRRAEREAQRVALAAAEERAKEAAPGSRAQLLRVRAALNMTRASHRVAIEQCNQMTDQVTAALAEGSEAQA